jgi:hypothetical protein
VISISTGKKSGQRKARRKVAALAGQRKYFGDEAIQQFAAWRQ